MSDPLTLAPGKARNNVKSRILLALAVLVIALGAVYCFLDSRLLRSSHAQVEGFSFAVLSPADGRIKTLLVADGQRVKAGSVLLALDEAPLRQAVLEASAAVQLAAQGGVPSGSADPQILRAIEELSRQAAGYRENEQGIRQFLEHWSAEHSRAMLILRSASGNTAEQRAQAVADEAQARLQMDQYRSQLDSASRQRAEAEAALQRLRQAQSPPSPGRGQLDLWLARLAQAEQALEDSVIIAPNDGLALNLAVRAGQAVSAGDQLLTFIPRAEGGGEFWVTALFDKQQAIRLRIGQPCRVTVADGPMLEGVVASILPGSDGSLVRINLAEDSAVQGVMPGQSATVTARAR